jgi:transcription elongation GreA/GreB family factor
MGLPPVDTIQPSTKVVELSPTIRIGTTVTVLFKGKEIPETYKIVRAREDKSTRLDLGEVSNESPFGKSRIGHSTGETVSYTVNNIEITLKIIDITPPTEP